MKEWKLRVEAALRSARAAMEEGIVPGGGAAYIHAQPAIRAYMETLSGDRRTGAGIMDPAKVSRTALLSAASASAVFLTAGAGVTEV